MWKRLHGLFMDKIIRFFSCGISHTHITITMDNREMSLAPNQLLSSNVKRRLLTKSTFPIFKLNMYLLFSGIQTKAKSSVPSTYDNDLLYSSDDEYDLEDSIHLAKVRLCKKKPWGLPVTMSIFVNLSRLQIADQTCVSLVTEGKET